MSSNWWWWHMRIGVIICTLLHYYSAIVSKLAERLLIKIKLPNLWNVWLIVGWLLQVFGSGALSGRQLRVGLRPETQYQCRTRVRWRRFFFPPVLQKNTQASLQSGCHSIIPYPNPNLNFMFSVRSGLLSTLVGEKSVTQRWEVTLIFKSSDAKNTS